MDLNNDELLIAYQGVKLQRFAIGCGVDNVVRRKQLGCEYNNDELRKAALEADLVQADIVLTKLEAELRKRGKAL